MKRKGRDKRIKYLGLDPSSFILSSYHCRTCHQVFSSNVGVMVFCPQCGVPAKAEAKIQASSLNTYKALNCRTCASELHTNMEPEDLVNNKTYCPECGDRLKVKSEDLDDSYDDTDDIEEDSLDEIEELDSDADIENLDDLDDLEEEEDALISAEVIAEDDEEDEDSDDDSDEEESDEDDSEEDEDSDEEEESDDSEESEDEESKKAESALSTHVKRMLASPIKDRENVTFDLWNTGNGNMVRNVIISGVPVARIHLEDQEKPEELEKVFPNKLYEDTLIEQMERKPVHDVLQAAEARFFNFAESKQKPVKEQVKATVNKELNAFRTKFKETFLAVMSGANKNLFNDVTNTLKQELWAAIAEQGIDHPEKIIEPAFDNASEPFLDQIFDKTVTLMEKGDDVRNEIIQMVSSSGTVAIGGDSDDDDEMSLRDRLVKGSFPVNVSSSSYGETRDSLRSRLSLRRK